MTTPTTPPAPDGVGATSETATTPIIDEAGVVRSIPSSMLEAGLQQYKSVPATQSQVNAASLATEQAKVANSTLGAVGAAGFKYLSAVPYLGEWAAGGATPEQEADNAKALSKAVDANPYAAAGGGMLGDVAAFTIADGAVGAGLKGIQALRGVSAAATAAQTAAQAASTSRSVSEAIALAEQATSFRHVIGKTLTTAGEWGAQAAATEALTTAGHQLSEDWLNDGHHDLTAEQLIIHGLENTVEAGAGGALIGGIGSGLWNVGKQAVTKAGMKALLGDTSQLLAAGPSGIMNQARALEAKNFEQLKQLPEFAEAASKATRGGVSEKQLADIVSQGRAGQLLADDVVAKSGIPLQDWIHLDGAITADLAARGDLSNLGAPAKFALKLADGIADREGATNPIVRQALRNRAEQLLGTMASAKDIKDTAAKSVINHVSDVLAATDQQYNLQILQRPAQIAKTVDPSLGKDSYDGVKAYLQVAGNAIDEAAKNADGVPQVMSMLRKLKGFSERLSNRSEELRTLAGQSPAMAQAEAAQRNMALHEFRVLMDTVGSAVGAFNNTPQPGYAGFVGVFKILRAGAKDALESDALWGAPAAGATKELNEALSDYLQRAFRFKNQWTTEDVNHKVIDTIVGGQGFNVSEALENLKNVRKTFTPDSRKVVTNLQEIGTVKGSTLENDAHEFFAAAEKMFRVGKNELHGAPAQLEQLQKGIDATIEARKALISQSRAVQLAEEYSSLAGKESNAYLGPVFGAVGGFLGGTPGLAMGVSLGYATDFFARPVKSLDRIMSLARASEVVGNKYNDMVARLIGGAQGEAVRRAAKAELKQIPFSTDLATLATALLARQGQLATQIQSAAGTMLATPKVASAYAQKSSQLITNIIAHMPARYIEQADRKRNGVGPNVPYRTPAVTATDDRRAGAYVQGATQPLQVLQHATLKTLTRAHVQGMEDTYPALVAKLREDVSKRIMESKTPMDRDIRRQLGLLLGIPLDPSTSSAFVKSAQASHWNAPGGNPTQEQPQGAPQTKQLKPAPSTSKASATSKMESP